MAKKKLNVYVFFENNDATLVIRSTTMFTAIERAVCYKPKTNMLCIGCEEHTLAWWLGDAGLRWLKITYGDKTDIAINRNDFAPQTYKHGKQIIRSLVALAKKLPKLPLTIPAPVVKKKATTKKKSVKKK